MTSLAKEIRALYHARNTAYADGNISAYQRADRRLTNLLLHKAIELADAVEHREGHGPCLPVDPDVILLKAGCASIASASVRRRGSVPHAHSPHPMTVLLDLVERVEGA